MRSSPLLEPRAASVTESMTHIQDLDYVRLVVCTNKGIE